MRFARPGRGPPSRTGRLAPRCKVKRNDFALTFSTYTFFPKHAMREDADGSGLHSVLSRLEIVEPLNRRALGKLEPERRGERPRLTCANLCKFIVSRTA